MYLISYFITGKKRMSKQQTAPLTSLVWIFVIENGPLPLQNQLIHSTAGMKTNKSRNFWAVQDIFNTERISAGCPLQMPFKNFTLIWPPSPPTNISVELFMSRTLDGPGDLLVLTSGFSAALASFTLRDPVFPNLVSGRMAEGTWHTRTAAPPLQAPLCNFYLPASSPPSAIPPLLYSPKSSWEQLFGNRQFIISLSQTESHWVQPHLKKKITPLWHSELLWHRF